MNSIISYLFTVLNNEEDVFTLFCHLIENIFPDVSHKQHFFDKEESFLQMRTEFQVFSKIVEKTRPSIVKNLTAVYKVRRNGTRQNDFYAFEVNMNKLAERWYLSLFTLGLPSNAVARIWDLIFFYGFDVFHRIGIALLVYHEKNIIKVIKGEGKTLGIERCVDSLVFAGSRAIQSILESIKPINISTCIKTILNSKNNSQLVRSNYSMQCEKYQRQNKSRIIKLRQSRSLLLCQNFTSEAFLQISSEIVSFNFEKLSLADLIRIFQKFSNLKPTTILNIFNSINFHLKEKLDYQEFLLNFSLLIPGSLQSRLTLFSEALPKIPLKDDDFLGFLIKIEKFLDPFSNNFIESLNESHKNWLRKRREEVEFFAEEVLNNQLLGPFVKVIQALDEDQAFSPELRIADINLSGSYSNFESSDVSSEEFDEGSLDKIKEQVVGIHLDVVRDEEPRTRFKSFTNDEQCEKIKSHLRETQSEEEKKSNESINEKILSTKFSYEELGQDGGKNQKNRKCTRLCAKPTCVIY
jgi:hypothetical protein